MSQAIIPLVFEQYLQNKTSLGLPTDLNEIIFAYIPDLDLSQPIDRITQLPPMGQWVHQQDVDQVGKSSANAVVYSAVIPSSADEFTFNAMFLRDKNVADGVGMIVYKNTETKEPGMTLTKSMLMAFDGAASSANVTIPVETWQIDFSARLAGIDESARLAYLAVFGPSALVTGLNVTHVGANEYHIDAGIAYVKGLSANVDDAFITTPTNAELWLDVVRVGSELEQGDTLTAITTEGIGSNKQDYIDADGEQHYVGQLATMQDGHVVMVLPQGVNSQLADIDKRTSKAFEKALVSEPAFKANGQQVLTNCDLVVVVGGVTLSFAENTQIALPALVAGSDYAIYATLTGLVASSNFTIPEGHTSADSRRVGGFHVGQEGVKSHSFYDLKFKPTAADPRGMVLTPAGFWADIYLLNTAPDLMGTSAFNVQIADGASTPKIPKFWGGNGSTQYPNFTQYIATEVLAAYGKRLPNQHEFQILALGSTTGHTSATDPIKTKHDINARSSLGCEQVSGHMWQWGSEVWGRGDGVSGYDWRNEDTGGQGSVYANEASGVGASRFGASWSHAGNAGSRASFWSDEPWDSSDHIGARGICDHLELT